MDIKPWEYADFPAFNEPVPGATRVPTTGDEIGVTYHPDVPYATAGTTTLHLQILVPQTRNQTDATTYPCMVHVQGSAWMKQDRTALVPTLSRIAERGFVDLDDLEPGLFRIEHFVAEGKRQLAVTLLAFQFITHKAPAQDSHRPGEHTFHGFSGEALCIGEP